MFPIIITILLMVLFLNLFVIFHDGLCDKYDRFSKQNEDLSRLQIVDTFFHNYTQEDRRYIISEC